MYSDLIALEEGWGVFDAGLYGDGTPRIEIQRIDELDVFTTDEQAWELVVSRAREGSRMHITALGLVDVAELNAIKKHTGWEG